MIKAISTLTPKVSRTLKVKTRTVVIIIQPNPIITAPAKTRLRWTATDGTSTIFALNKVSNKLCYGSLLNPIDDIKLQKLKSTNPSFIDLKATQKQWKVHLNLGSSFSSFLFL